MNNPKVLAYQVGYLTPEGDVCPPDKANRMCLDFKGPIYGFNYTAENISSYTGADSDEEVCQYRQLHLRLMDIEGVAEVAFQRYAMRIVRAKYVTSWDTILEKVLEVICDVNGYVDTVAVNFSEPQKGDEKVSERDAFLKARKSQLEKLDSGLKAAFEAAASRCVPAVIMNIDLDNLAVVIACVEKALSQVK